MSHGILFQVMVYLLAAIICVPLAKRFRLSSVLGYLIAGMIIGPHVLALVGAEGESVMHFSEFGVVVMLFLVGLELEPKKFWAMRKHILGMGLFQVIGTVILVTCVGLLLAFPWRTSLAASIAIAMSSTAIALQSLKEKNLMHKPVGKSSFSVLLFQDISVIPFLALLPILAVQKPAHAEHAASNPAWIQAITVLAAIVAVGVLGRYLVVPLFRIIAHTKIRELFIATALLLVVGIAWIMNAVGLSPALGTFMAGILLANSEFRHELESDLDPFKGLLLGLFFISVGAAIDFAMVAQAPGLIVGFTFGVILLKSLVLAVLAKWTKLSWQDSMLFVVGLSQVGEFAFVLLAFVAQLGMVTEHQATFLVAVTALSMTITPLLGLVSDVVIRRTSKAEETPKNTNYDRVDHHSELILVGFADFGSTVGRFLKGHGVNPVILDHDIARVQLLRKMGFTVFFGDATRIDLLNSAGAESAKILVSALESQESSLELARICKRHYPHLKLIFRAHDREHGFELLEQGVSEIYRDSLYTSVAMGVDLLHHIGFRRYHATRHGQKFLKYDHCAFNDLAKHRYDEDGFILNARRHFALHEQLLRQDLDYHPETIDNAWDSSQMKKG